MLSGSHKHLCIICKLRRSDALATHLHPKTLVLQKQQQRLSNKQVQLWGEWASLPHTGTKPHPPRDKAVDIGTGLGIREQHPHPSEETTPQACQLQEAIQEGP
jgi:hypothetical protein